MNNNRNTLLRKVQEYSFALYDVSLYLDTHPHDQNALAYFNHYQKLYKEAADEYSKHCGLLQMADQPINSENWLWINEPWPWQRRA